MLELEIAKIIITEMNNQQVLLMKEKNGKREFPIVIGIFEATAIDRRVKNVLSPRPLTHNLICNAVEMLGGTIKDVYIHRLEEQTYFASLRIIKDKELLELDCRPSDAVAVAISFDPWLPIWIEEKVLEQAAKQVN